MQTFHSLKKMRLGALATTLLLFFIGCEAKTLAPLDQNSVTDQHKTIIVIGLRFENRNLPSADGSPAVWKSEELIQSYPENLKRGEGNDDLGKPLHFIYNQQFEFKLEASGESQTEFNIARANSHVGSYNIYSLHQVSPGQLSLEDVAQKELLLHFPSNNNLQEFIDYAYETPVLIPLPKLKWDLKPGEIVYLGDITIYFTTNQIRFGLFQRLTNQEITPEYLQISDAFQDFQTWAKKNWPWFPSEKVLNISQMGSYDWKNWSWEVAIAKKDLPKDLEVDSSNPSRKNGFW